MPGPRSTTRSSTRSPCALARDQHRPPGRAVAHALATRLATIALEQRRVGEDLGQVVRDADARPGGPAARGRPARAGTTSSSADRLRLQRRARRPAGGSCRAGCSTRRSSRSRDSSAVASSSARSSARPGRRRGCAGSSTAALAEASGVRRSWLTAASRAVRIRSASASGPAVGRLLGQPLLAQRDGGLGGEGLQHAPVGGRQRPAAQRPARGRRRRARPRRPRRRRRRAAADGGGDPPAAGRRRPGRRVLGTAFEQGDASPARRSPAAGPAAPPARRSPRSTLPARVDSISASAPARAASRVRRAARSTTALTATRDHDEHDAGRAGSSALGDGERCGAAG